MKLLKALPAFIGSAYAAGDLYKMFNSCDESKIENKLWESDQIPTGYDANGYDLARTQLQCIENPPLPRGVVEDDRTIFKSCRLTCKSGYEITSDLRVGEVIREGYYTCRRVHDNYQYYYWRYNDGTKEEAKALAALDPPQTTLNVTSHFSGCKASNCFTPLLLTRKGETTEEPTRHKGWAWKWDSETKDSNEGNHYIKGAVAKPQQTGKLYLFKPAIMSLMPSADFATLGYTLILTLHKETKGRFYVVKGNNHHAHRDGEIAANWGKTFSFSSRIYNRDLSYDTTAWENLKTAAKAARAADQANWPTKDIDGTPTAYEPNYEKYIDQEDLIPYRVAFQITFQADQGENLPDLQNIHSVEIVEGEYAHTECRTDSVNFSSYGQYAPGTSNLQDLDAVAFDRGTDTYLFNAVGHHDYDSSCPAN